MFCYSSLFTSEEIGVWSERKRGPKRIGSRQVVVSLPYNTRPGFVRLESLVEKLLPDLYGP